MVAPPDAGRANDDVVRLLAEILELPKRDVEIVTGHAARDKVVRLAGIDPKETERRLEAASAGLAEVAP